MTVQTLDVRDPNQVGSQSSIQGANLGDGRTLIVLSGIANIDWKYNSDKLSPGETEINLGVFAANLEQWSVFAGLTSISANSDRYVQALNAVDLRRRDTGELFLHLDTALMGTWAYLGRISYQVVATLVQARPYIAGAITWPATLFRPASLDPALALGVLTVFANSVEQTGSGPFGGTKLTRLPPDGTIFKVEAAGDNFVAHYRIDGPPLAQELEVTVTLGNPFLSSAAAGQQSGPLLFTLTGSAPSLDNMDFTVFPPGRIK